jgi:hypothetical protein
MVGKEYNETAGVYKVQTFRTTQYLFIAERLFYFQCIIKGLD